MAPCICLIHTADLHGRLRLDQARRLAKLKQDHQALLLDAGDALASPNLFALPWMDHTVELMNQAGYDALAVGNREHALTARALSAKLSGFRFPVISTNLLPRSEPLPFLHRWITTEAGGVRTGVFALSEPIINPGSAWERLSPVRYVPAEEVIAEAVGHLREQCDVLVALSHYGRRPEAEVAERHPEIDLILAGHAHVAECSLQHVGRTAVSRTCHYGRCAAILTFDGQSWRQERVEL